MYHHAHTHSSSSVISHQGGAVAVGHHHLISLPLHLLRIHLSLNLLLQPRLELVNVPRPRLDGIIHRLLFLEALVCANGLVVDVRLKLLLRLVTEPSYVDAAAFANAADLLEELLARF